MRGAAPAIIALIALNRAHRSSALMSLMICRASSERRRPCCGRNATCGPAIGRSNTRTTWFLGRHVLALKLDPVSEPKLSGATPAPAWIPANLRRLLSGERCVRSSSLTSRHHGAPRISRFFSCNRDRQLRQPEAPRRWLSAGLSVRNFSLLQPAHRRAGRWLGDNGFAMMDSRLMISTDSPPERSTMADRWPWP